MIVCKTYPYALPHKILSNGDSITAKTLNIKANSPNKYLLLVTNKLNCFVLFLNFFYEICIDFESTN